MSLFVEEIERFITEQITEEMKAQHAFLSESAVENAIQFKLDCLAKNLVSLGWPK